MPLNISQEDFRNKCLHCKKPLSVKYITHEVEDNLSQVVFLDSHKICAKLAFEISLLENEMNLQEKNLLKLKKRYAALKMKQAVKSSTLD